MSHEEFAHWLQQGCEKFASMEVRDSIERLTEKQTRKLSQDKGLMDALLGGVKSLQEELNKRFVGRSELIEMGLACFLAHVPMVALGPPGTAKSNVFRMLSYGLGLQRQPMTIAELAGEMDKLARSTGDASGGAGPVQERSERARPDAEKTGEQESRGYFEYLVTRFTTPEELLGPAHLSLMIHRAVFYRQTLGLLPEAEVAFLDEIFKANSAILNALLSIMNERLFYNAGRPTRVPLCMVFGASNEPPEEKDLSALYDRFPVRVPCLPIDDTFENTQDLLKKSVAQACESLFPGSSQEQERTGPIEQVATVNHFRLLHRVLHVKYGGRLKDHSDSSQERFLEAFYKTFKSLRREFEISDRSYAKLYGLARGLALLRSRDEKRGDDTLTSDELDVFKYCFRDLEAAPPLQEAVEERKRRFRLS